MGRPFTPRSYEIYELMSAHGMGEPFTIHMLPEEREGRGHAALRQRIKNCANRMEPPRRVSINRHGFDELVVTLLGEKRK